MSVKNCGHHHYKRRKLYRRLLIGVAVLLGLIALVVFLVWIILRPSKPHFTLQDVTIYNFTVSPSLPYTLTTTMQITIGTTNPNDRIGIYYVNLDVYGSYRNQHITLPTVLPTSYQGHREVAVWSPMLYGYTVPVSPYLQQVLAQDLNVGAVLVNIKIDGRLKWKVGTWISGKYQLNVNCPAYIRFSEQNSGFGVSSVMKFQLVQACSVETGLDS
ncbi:hypothetical protein FNV43_RR17711 [Rhamnella rubrinervis]|uniref:Late embryogenesis abundant protein LEA-2 subgroup domain-containing protein n=1 Tax=Rhamnella rubrinervis TaxID=2594499 RepID=A0A8K0E288_9ROSA|nr:hypothetical protein FNV43_RR17711 [Rhamnella rubrinervis]